MVINEPGGSGSTAALLVAPLLARDAEFEKRWTAWVARGRVHEQDVRQRFIVAAGVTAIGAAIAFAVLGW